MFQKNGAGETAQATMDERASRDPNPAMPKMPATQLPPERVDDTCLLLMQRAAEIKRQMQAQAQAVDQLVNAVVAERCRLEQGDGVTAEGLILRAPRPEPAEVP